MFARALALATVMFAAAPVGAEVVAPPSAAAADFLTDAQLFFRIVSCGSTDPLPATVDAKIVDAHCAEMAKRYESVNAKYITPARAFFADK